MIFALLLAAAAPATAVEAGGAFSDMAQKHGQWTAFRAYAAPDALMLVPGATNAQQWLKDEKDPPASVHWWPSRSWVSCDGALAVNIGPALYGTKGYGSFTTVWQRQGDGGWKWLLDQGHQLPRALPATERPQVTRASCSGRPVPRKAASPAAALASAGRGLMVLEEGAMPSPRASTAPPLDPNASASGSSPDGTVFWRVNAVNVGAEGARALQIFLWDGRQYRLRLPDLHRGRAG